MGIVVANNNAAFNVWTSFAKNTSNLRKSMNHLSTGLKTVGDDPSGIGISERLRSQARSTAMARNNLDNAISLIQTADGWLQKTNDMLSRMHELTIEANDGTKSSEDKANVQIEFKALQDEISRITSKSTAAAKFNGLYLFRGGNGVAVQSGDGVETGSVTVQIGADNKQEVSISLEDLQVTNTNVIGTVTTYGYNSDHVTTSSAREEVEWASVVDSTNGMSVTTANASGMVQKAIDHIANARASVGSQQNRLEHSRSGLLAYEDNLRAAESKMRDVDVARESTELAKYQILSQVSNAMLAQANQPPSGALQLLG